MVLRVVLINLKVLFTSYPGIWNNLPYIVITFIATKMKVTCRYLGLRYSQNRTKYDLAFVSGKYFTFF